MLELSVALGVGAILGLVPGVLVAFALGALIGAAAQSATERRA